jgi:hypothetical protein
MSDVTLLDRPEKDIYRHGAQLDRPSNIVPQEAHRSYAVTLRDQQRVGVWLGVSGKAR